MALMPQHALCFTDLSSNNDSSATLRSVITSSHHHHHPTTLFVREENKTCSFVIKNPVSLLCVCQTDDKLPSNAIANDNICQSRSDATQCTEKKHLVAMASITSCTTSNNVSDSEPQPSAAEAAREIFLFGGLELITNVKTIEVYVSRSIEDSIPSTPAESYLTTCKGVPVRDLPPLPAPLTSTGETMMNKIDFFKFILVSPGGAKPLKRVRLKFVGCNTSSVGCVVVRTLKVKGRLADTIPSTTSQMQAMPRPKFPDGDTKCDTTIQSIERADNSHDLIGTNGIVSTTSQQHVGRVQIQSFIRNSTQPLQVNHQQEKNHAEIVNAIVGLGIYLKQSEERTMVKLDTMLTNMEMRIMERMDDIAGRLNAIEQTVMVAKREDADEIK